MGALIVGAQPESALLPLPRPARLAVRGLGGLAGVVLGLMVSAGYALHQQWPLTIPVHAVLAGVATSVVIGALAGLYPASRAARTSPSVALASR